MSSGLVSFALGTDTAGSGRIPASFNNLVGLKPTRGLLSTSGVVPACRSLDCVSVFALTVHDAEPGRRNRGWPGQNRRLFARRRRPRALSAGRCARDASASAFPSAPYLTELDYGGTRADFERAVERLKRLGGIPVELDFEPFHATGQMLYEGAFVAERAASVQSILSQNPSGVLPVISKVLSRAEGFSATDAFLGAQTLAEHARRTRLAWPSMDLFIVPTTPFFPKVSEVEADPIGLNSRLGALMNFANLLDLVRARRAL